MLRRLTKDQPQSFAFTPANLAWAEAQIAKYPTDATYSAAVTSALANIGPKIKAAGKLVIPNFGSWGSYRDTVDPWLKYVSGGMEEQFVTWGGATAGSGSCGPLSQRITPAASRVRGRGPDRLLLRQRDAVPDGDDLGQDRDRDLGRRAAADVEADRAVQPLDLGRAEVEQREALLALGGVGARAERADVERR